MARTTKIGSVIRQRRLHLGLSQQAVADKSKTGRAYLCRVEGGAISPTWETIERIAAALGTSAPELLRSSSRRRPAA